MAFHQPGHSDLHRVFWNPPGAGRSLLADAVPDIRCIRNFRAAGNVQILPFGMEINELKAKFLFGHSNPFGFLKFHWSGGCYPPDGLGQLQTH